MTAHVKFSSRILFLYIFFQIAVILLSVVLTAELRTVYLYFKDVSASPASYTVESAVSESYFSYIFNQGYFSASAGCLSKATKFFWTFIKDNCPSTIQQDRCQRCYFYTTTLCQADSFSCYQGVETGPTCPYTICRSGLLTWAIAQLKLFYALGVAFSVYQTLVIVLVIAYLAIHVIEKVDFDFKTGFKVIYRTEKPMKPSEYEQVALKRTEFKDEDEDAPQSASTVGGTAHYNSASLASIVHMMKKSAHVGENAPAAKTPKDEEFADV